MSETEVAKGMYAKGYRYILKPQCGSFEPLYAKTVSQATHLHRDYPTTTFDVRQINADGTER